MAQVRRLGHLPRPHRSRRAEARRHLVLHGRHEDAGHRHPAAARAHRRGDVQRGVLRRRVRARRLPRRRRSTTAGAPRARRSRTSACTWAAGNTIGGGSSSDPRARSRRAGSADDPLVLDEVGGLVATGARARVPRLPADARRARRRRPGGSEARSASCSASARPARAGGRARAARRRRRGRRRRRPARGAAASCSTAA